VLSEAAAECAAESGTAGAEAARDAPPKVLNPSAAQPAPTSADNPTRDLMMIDEASIWP